MQLSRKQNEYIVNATHRWNIKSGAVRSGKSYVDTAFIIPFRIRERAGKAGVNVILGVSKESIERNVLQPMREIYTDIWIWKCVSWRTLSVEYERLARLQAQLTGRLIDLKF